MKETCCRFGPREQLIGVLTEPSTSAKKTTLVLVSAGVTPKSGPFGLYAELARRLAADGLRTLRFDLGGIGDSGQEFAEHALRERTRLQIQAAVEHLEARLGPTELALGGLCSGAEDAFSYAAQDERVKRVVMIDPFAYVTPGFVWRDLAYRARRRALRAVGAFQPLPRAQRRSLVSYDYLPPAQSERLLRTLLARRVKVHFIYTGGMLSRFNHRGQLRAMFRGLDFGELVELDHLPSLDHTQASTTDRGVLIETITRRLLGTAP